jgi:hypothetical protein
MKGALGDQGLFVTLQEMKDWGPSWDAIFLPKQRQQRLQQYRHHHRYHESSPHQPHRDALRAISRLEYREVKRATSIMLPPSST